MITYPEQYKSVALAAERMAFRGLRAGVQLNQLLQMAAERWRGYERQVAQTVIRSLYHDNGGRE